MRFNKSTVNHELLLRFPRFVRSCRYSSLIAGRIYDSARVFVRLLSRQLNDACFVPSRTSFRLMRRAISCASIHPSLQLMPCFIARLLHSCHDDSLVVFSVVFGWQPFPYYCFSARCMICPCCGLRFRSWQLLDLVTQILVVTRCVVATAS